MAAFLTSATVADRSSWISHVTPARVATDNVTKESMSQGCGFRFQAEVCCQHALGDDTFCRKRGLRLLLGKSRRSCWPCHLEAHPKLPHLQTKSLRNAPGWACWTADDGTTMVPMWHHIVSNSEVMQITNSPACLPVAEICLTIVGRDWVPVGGREGLSQDTNPRGSCRSKSQTTAE